MNNHYIRSEYGLPLPLKRRVKLLLVAMLLSWAAALVYTAAHAQSFTASVTQGQAPLSTVLTWSVPGATSCTAGSTPGWTGSVPASGTRTLTGINVPMKLTLDCTALGSALVSWTHGADIVGLTRTGYIVNAEPQNIFGQVPVTVDLKVPGATAYKFDGLAPGPYVLSVRTSSIDPSSNVTLISGSIIATPKGATAPGPLTVTGVATHREVQLTILPNPPASVTVSQDTMAYEIHNRTGVLTARHIGHIAPNTNCELGVTRKVGTVTYTRIPMLKPYYVGQIDLIVSAAKLADAWAKCA